MPLLEWKNTFSVGVPSIDHEHQELIELINDAYESVLHRASEESVADFLGEIYAKISAHFALEERVMRERDYDQYPDHKADHEQLLDDIRDIMDEFEDNASFNAPELAERLQGWFSLHFQTQDARLHKFLG